MMLLMLTLNVYAQECAGPDDFPNNSANVTTNCSRSSSDFLLKYGDDFNSDLSYWLPTSSTPIREIKINFIIIQNTGGTGNFSATGTCGTTTDVQYLHDVVQEVNNKYADISDPSDDWRFRANCTTFSANVYH